MNKIFIPYGDGAAIYLPFYVRVFRKVEQEILCYLDRIGGVEIMLPKIISPSDVAALKACNPRFVDEWSTEQYKVIDSNNRHVGFLAHWQCEPIYRNLLTLLNEAGNDKITIFFDNSGYSYRKEGVDTPFTKTEFRRVEVFMAGEEDEVKRNIEGILNKFMTYLKEYDAQIVDRPEESFNGNEKVRDVIVHYKNCEIEVVGSHYHLDSFGSIIKWPGDRRLITACCGIATSRIAMIEAQTAEDETNLTRQ